MILTRDKCESELILALSRYIGYTTGAYDIDRIAELSLYFLTKPSLLEIELKKIIQKTEKVTEDYSTGIINFCVSLGFVEKYNLGGRLSKIGLSSLGRAYCAAHQLNLKKYKKHLLSYAVLQYDSDIYLLLLEILSEDNSLKGDKLHTVFLKKIKNLRNKRIEWIHQAFPNQILRDRIATKILWIKTTPNKKLQLIDPKSDFARHHSSPRKGWAEKIGHIKKNGKLTKAGKNILLKILNDNGDYFWLGPPIDCFNVLRIPKELERKPYSPAWNVLRPSSTCDHVPNELIQELIDHMINAYPFIRMVRYNQAPLEAVIPYIYFLESNHNLRLDEKELLNAVFSENRKKFSLMSKRDSIFGHYQLRKFS